MRMKHMRVLLLVALLLVSLCACGKKEESEQSDKSVEGAAAQASKLKSLPLDEMINSLRQSQSQLSDCKVVTVGSDRSNDYLEGIFNRGKMASQIEVAAVYSTEANADEMSIFHIKPEATDITVDSLKQTLEQYRQDRTSIFVGYAPAEEEKLKNAEIIVKDQYVVFLCCNDVEAAKSVVDTFFQRLGKTSGDKKEMTVQATSIEPSATSEVTKKPANIEKDTKSIMSSLPVELTQVAKKMYDNSDIVKAYETGDSSLVSDPKRQQVLEHCKKVIKEEINESMTDAEKEIAIHNYMVSWMQYDKKSLGREHKMTEEADNPYGALINKTAICTGYTTTFQLFMDLLEIPCISVEGKTIVGADGDHAWNMVNLEGNWYYVDVTWDDPIGMIVSKKVSSSYLNVTEKDMILRNHKWDWGKYPKTPDVKFELENK